MQDLPGATQVTGVIYNSLIVLVVHRHLNVVRIRPETMATTDYRNHSISEHRIFMVHIGFQMGKQTNVFTRGTYLL